MFKGMPYERQLKERQLYQSLSIFVELIKSDVNPFDAKRFPKDLPK